MTRRAAIILLTINAVSVIGGVILLAWVYARALPFSGITPESIGVAAARLAAQPTQSAIAEVLYRNDSYNRSLQHIIEAQRELHWWLIAYLTFLATINALYVLPALRPSTRNA